MQVKDIMTKNPVFIGPDDSITAAARKMIDIDCGVLPVGEGKKRCVGIITDRDIVLRTLIRDGDPKESKVKDSMTSKVYSCQEEDTLEKAAILMREYQVNRLIVKDKDTNITGIITFGSMLWKTKSASEVGRILDHAAPRKLAAPICH